MIKIGIIFGGASREREISFAGGRTVYDNLNKSIFTPVPLFLDSVGNLILLNWEHIYKGTIRDFYPPVEFQKGTKYQLYAEHLQNKKVDWDAIINSVGEKVEWADLPSIIDIAFLALHGIQGEDGSIQGLLNFYKIPYTGSGILASAMGMNKAFQKEILQNTRFNKTSFFSLSKEDWQIIKAKDWLSKIKKEIGFPYVVRPANQGSSIGVSIVETEEIADLRKAMQNAFFAKRLEKKYWQQLSDEAQQNWINGLLDVKASIGLPIQIDDDVYFHPEDLLIGINEKFKEEKSLLLESLIEEPEVVVESFIKGREFSCVVIETEINGVIALPPTEIVKNSEVYDYRSKYLPGLSRKITPIDLPHEAIQNIRKECEALYKLMRFNVYARIDGFYKTDGTIVLNDPNTTSGMLPSSFFFHQAAEIGLNPSQFITFIIGASLEARSKEGGDVRHVNQLKNRLEELLEKAKKSTGNKKKIAVILGGYSSERHISVESGRNIFEKLSSSNKYEAMPLFLTQENGKDVIYQIPIHLLLKDNADDIQEKLKILSNHPIISLIRKETEYIAHQYGANTYDFFPRKIEWEALSNIVSAVFIAIHGRPGEDGTLQKRLDEIGIPYNGSPSKSAKTTIDKHRTKEILRKNGFKVADDFLIHKKDWNANKEVVLEQLFNTIELPLIAKPIDDGCSSAVKKINTKKELIVFTDAMFRDEKVISKALFDLLELKPKEEFPQKEVVLIESLIDKKDAQHFLEVTGGMLTKYDENGKISYESFEPSEALAGEAILSLEEKFLAGQGQNITPARFDKDPQKRCKISKQVQADLVRAAEILGVEGYCRIDAFVRIYNENKIETVIIEVNSLPGMTPATCIFHQAALNHYQPIDFIDKILTFALNKKKN